MVKRKMLAADEEVARRIVKVAEEKGQTLYSLVNESLEQATRAYSLGLTLKRVMDERNVMETQKASGAVLVPMHTWSWLIKKLYPQEKEALQDKWREAGRWFGKYLLHSEEPVKLFIQVLQGTRWDLDEVKVENQEGETMKMNVVSKTLPEENTELLMNYMQGAMESLGYQTENSEHMRGIITLQLKKVKG